MESRRCPFDCDLLRVTRDLSVRGQQRKSRHYSLKEEREGFKALAEFWFMKIAQVDGDRMTSSAQGHQSVTVVSITNSVFAANGP